MGKVLITEKVHPIGPQLLRAAGHQVVQVENRDMAQIAREIVDADAVIVRIIDLPGSLLKTAEHLRIVSKHGVGIDNIDLDYCRKASIQAKCPFKVCFTFSVFFVCFSIHFN